MLKLARFEPRFLPNMQLVKDWNLGSIVIDNSICPTKELNKNSTIHVSSGEYAYVSSPWLNDDQTSIVLLDKSFFVRHNYDLRKGFPTVKVSTSKYDLQFVNAVAKPTHLRVVSNTIEGVKTLNVEHEMYGLLTFHNILCTKRSDIKDDTLLIPDHLWNFLIYTKIWIE
jgi:hypothetical protein